MIERIESIPKKCKFFYLAKANEFESNRKNLDEYFKYVKNSQKDLYSHLRGRVSGRITKEEFVKEYIPLNGIKHNTYLRIKAELEKINNLNLEYKGIRKVYGRGWNHFLFGSSTSERDTKNKLYITIDYDTLSADAFEKMLLNLALNNYEGQIKIAQPETTSMIFLQDDNIVIHPQNPEQLKLAEQVCVRTLQKNNVRISSGTYEEGITEAKDIRTPELKNLGIKSKKTSFTDAMAYIGCEFMLILIESNKQEISNFEDLRKMIGQLFLENGQFDNYIKQIYNQ